MCMRLSDIAFHVLTFDDMNCYVELACCFKSERSESRRVGGKLSEIYFKLEQSVTHISAPVLMKTDENFEIKLYWRCYDDCRSHFLLHDHPDGACFKTSRRRAKSAVLHVTTHLVPRP